MFDLNVLKQVLFFVLKHDTFFLLFIIELAADPEAISIIITSTTLQKLNVLIS